MRRAGLAADCSVCRGLCCIAKSFEAGESFAITKPAHVPCVHLDEGRRCSIYGEREEKGFSGCAAFDCYGAGPLATKLAERVGEAEVLRAFDVLCEIQEARWLLERALSLLPPRSDLACEISAQLRLLAGVAEGEARPLLRVDVDAVAADARRLLRGVGATLGDRETARRRLQLVG